MTTSDTELDHFAGSAIRRSDQRGKNSTKRSRIQLDLSVEAFGELEVLAVKVGAPSVNDFTRSALRFYRWFLENKEKGYQLMVEKDGKAVAIEVLF